MTRLLSFSLYHVCCFACLWQFLEAAQTFTEALDLIGEYDDSIGTSSLSRQLITLMNNRSAMYEKVWLGYIRHHFKLW